MRSSEAAAALGRGPARLPAARAPNAADCVRKRRRLVSVERLSLGIAVSSDVMISPTWRHLVMSAVRCQATRPCERLPLITYRAGADRADHGAHRRAGWRRAPRVRSPSRAPSPATTRWKDNRAL